MNSTSAVEVIIQALCPGPAEASALGAPFDTYASRSATRVARSAPAAGPVSASADGASRTTDRTRTAAAATAVDRVD